MTVPITSNLVALYEAESAVVDGSDVLTNWPDASGKGNHLVTVGAAPPGRVTSANGTPAIRFPNSADGYVDRVHATHPLIDLPMGDTTRTIMLMANFIADSLNVGGISYGTAAAGQLFGIGISGQSGSENVRGILGSGTYDVTTSLTKSAGTWYFLTGRLVVIDGLRYFAVGRGTTYPTPTLRDPSNSFTINTTPTYLRIGNNLGMDVAAAAIYDTDLSLEQLSVLRQHFTAKYGTTTPALMEARINGNQMQLIFNKLVQVGSGGSTGFTLDLTGGAATATYASGTGTNTLVYTLSRVVEVGETGPLGYTQGGNGIEATDGTDVATFSAFEVNVVSEEVSEEVVGWQSDQLYLDEAQEELVANASDVRVVVFTNITNSAPIVCLTNQSVVSGRVTVTGEVLGSIGDNRTFVISSASGGWNIVRENVPLIDTSAL